MTRLTWPQAIAWHLRRQHLDARLPRTKLVQLTSELCGLHAQVMSSAELTAWARLEGLRQGDIANALWKDGKLIKIWAMRHTLHLLPANEYGMWLKAFALYERKKSPRWLTWLGISQNELAAITEAVREALSDRLLTRQELADEITRRTNLPHVDEKLRMGWGSLLKPACYRGYLCFGPNKGQHAQFFYPGQIAGEDETALADVGRRYLAAYGPATERDFARWFFGGRQRAREFIAPLGDEAVEVEIEGTRAWMLRKHLRPVLQNEPCSTVRLLPAFDQYVFAAGLRSDRLLPGDFRSRIYRNQGWFSPVLLVDGRMEGVWRFERNGAKLTVTIEPFVPLKPKVRRAAAEEAERLAHFMERSPEIKWLT